MIDYREAGLNESGRNNYTSATQLVLTGIVAALVLKDPEGLAGNAYLNQLMEGSAVLVVGVLAVTAAVIIAAVHVCFGFRGGPYLIDTLETYTARAARVLATIPLMVVVLFVRADAVGTYGDVSLIAITNGLGALLIMFNTLTVINLLYALQDTKAHKDKT